ncbi:MAG: type II toxin-antitoxin system prevent-host-death family antitoxin [Candidatus Riflebacteria bacterium]|nr:type II toxin-antitoxin system prevent-host-death family antitoxin [Candidatus Riflebacteria bacterium]
MNVTISTLKARLSACLEKVRQGQEVTVLDRRSPLARIVPIRGEGEGLEVTAASMPLASLGTIRGVRLRKAADVVALLSLTRGER